MLELAILPLKRFHPKRYHPGNAGTWSGHLPFAHDVVAALRPQILVELGTHFGESYFGFCQAVEENAIGCKCYAVDTWRGDEHAGHYGEEVFDEVEAYNKLMYPAFSTLLRDTFDGATRQFGPASIDLLHIDGLHTYEAVKHDFDMWLPKMRPGGIVLLHDINARHGTFRVWELWEELRSIYPHFEFTHSFGLGVLRAGDPNPDDSSYLNLLFHSSEGLNTAIREQYVVASENLEYAYRLHGTPVSTELKATAQVFAGAQDGFQEERSVTAAIQPGEWRRYRFPLDQGCAVDQVRIDFANAPCVVEVASISIRTAANESELLYQVTQPAELLALKCHGDLLPIGGGGAKFFCFGPDPQVYLFLSGTPGLQQPIVVELWMRVDLEFSRIAALLQEDAAAALAERARTDSEQSRRTGTYETEVAKLRIDCDRMERERGLALRSMESLTSEVRMHQTERLILTAEFRRLAGVRRGLESENEEVRERLRREQNLRIAIEQEAAQGRTQLEQLRWTVANQASELDQLRPGSPERSRMEWLESNLRAREEELRHERARREDLEASYSWRLTGPVRGAMKLLDRSR